MFSCADFLLWRQCFACYVCRSCGCRCDVIILLLSAQLVFFYAIEPAECVSLLLRNAMKQDAEIQYYV
jgi:hypothetical protein